MMERQTKFICAGICLLASLSFLIGSIANHTYRIYASDGTDTEINLTSSRTPTITDGNGTLQYNQFITLDYTKASESEGHHIVLDEGGTIARREASYSLNTVTATFTGSLRIECGFENDYLTQEVVYMGELTSGTPFVLKGNYWRILALEETTIDDISLGFGCVSASNPVIEDKIGLITLPNTELQFTSIEKRYETTYLTVKCNYDRSKGDIVAEDLQVKGDNGAQVYNCSFIETLSSDTFIAYFDVSSQHAAILGNLSEKIVYCHLFVANAPWNTADGTTGTGNIGLNNSKLLSRTITVEGNKAITFGLRETKTGTKLAWLIYRNKNTYDFNPNFNDLKANKENIGNPFAQVNGGSTTCTTYAAEDAYRYGNTNGKTFNIKVVSNMATTATFALITGGRAGKTLTFNYVDDYNPNISSMTLNGSTAGVTGLTDKSYTFESYMPMGSWNQFIYCDLATLELNQGVNNISFTLSADKNVSDDSAQNNLNLEGISLTLADTAARVNLYHTYDLNYSPSISGTSSTTPNGEYDPFFEGNGGSVAGSPQVSAWGYKYEAGQLYRYGEILGYTWTMKVHADVATSATIRILCSSNASNRTATFRAERDTTLSNKHAYVNSLTLNGSTSGVTKSTNATTMLTWSDFLECELGTFNLVAGTNTITFQIKGVDSSSKLNMRGIVVESANMVCLGPSTY